MSAGDAKSTVTVIKADYANSTHAKAIVALVAEFALDESGGGEALPDEVLGKMVSELAKRPYAFTILAFTGGDSAEGNPAGLCHCFEGYSTFSSKGIVNIHDCYVSKDIRGKGVSQLLLRGVEEEARARGAGKLTLEVLEFNKIAHGAYTKFGFAAYELDPAMGKAMFWQKALAPEEAASAQKSAGASISVITADYANAAHAAATTSLIAEYALDPMGGSEAIADEVLGKMVSELVKRPQAFTVLAFADGGKAVGVCNCFESYSTFRGVPVVNIHDCFVAHDVRGQGIGQLLLRGVEEEARARGAAKLTLEVLEKNLVAQGSYRKFGFVPYELADGYGRAMFWQKMLSK